jgi:HNH endonuclease
VTKPAPIEQMLWGRSVRTPTGCLEYIGARRVPGRRIINHNGRNWQVYRLAYELTVGPIPPGMNINHHCDNPICIEISHLYVGTQAENIQDSIRRGRKARGSQASWAKLNEAQVLEIYAARAPIFELAAKYGVNKTTVANIKDGRNWRWLTGPLGTEPGRPA